MTIIKNNIAQLVFAALLIIQFGCSTHTGRYQQAHDSTPSRLPTEAELQDAVPRIEPYSRGGNKNYTVRGKDYKVLKHADNFSQSGIASWYGNKFHGHLTSNGEIYNMYAMSAAHKNLPLPTYLKVTNDANNKSVIVRVNDRGPFHQDRIIDLSYSAAHKLDMLKTGTAHVTITAINQIETQQPPLVNSPFKAEKPETSQMQQGSYIQVFATKSQSSALQTANALSLLYDQTTYTPMQNGIYRVQMGPFNHAEQLNNILLTLRDSGYPNAFKKDKVN